jgi:hypothetical protein
LWDEHQTRVVDRTFPLWTLLMLELWHREFTDVPEPSTRIPMTLAAPR